MIPKSIIYIHIDEKAEKSGEKFIKIPLYNQLCIASARVSNPNYKIKLYTNIPLNLDDNDILKASDENIENIIIPETYFDDIMLIGIKKIAHKSDFIRYKLLNDIGGIYSDTDIIINKSLDDLLGYDFVVSYQSVLQICNGFIITIPNNKIIKETLDNYYKDYRGDNWTYNSMIYLKDRIDSYLESDINLLVLGYKLGFHYPHFNHLIKSLCQNNEEYNCYAHHLWNSSTQGKYIKSKIEDTILNRNDRDYSYIENRVINIIENYNSL